MQPIVSRTSLVIAILLGACGAAAGESADPQLHSIFPMGGRHGASIELSFQGDDLDDAEALSFSHSGITAELIEDDEDEEDKEEGRFRVTVAEDVPPGDYDLWVLTPHGMSNPRRFVVGELPEINEQGGNDTAETAQEIPLPGTVNGRFDRAADIDWYRFSGEEGQHLTICCRSRSLDGTAEPVLSVIGPDGRELQHARDDRLEPVLHFTLPQAGSYMIRVAERAYRHDDFGFYRLSLSTGPRLLHAFPHLLTKGATQTVTLYGYELPDGTPVDTDHLHGLQELSVEVTAPEEGDADGGGWVASSGALLEGFRYRHPGLAGSVRFLLTDAEVTVEDEAASSGRDTAQPVDLPADIAGRFLTPRDVDWYRFSAKEDETLAIESFGDRLGNLMDLEVAIHDAEGKLLTTLEEWEAPDGLPDKFPLESLDAAETWEAPADGEYHLIVRDLYGGSVAGPHRLYRLSLQPPKPAFHVFAMPPGDADPKGVAFARGGSGTLELIAVRQNGFEGAIRVRPLDLPEGIAADETEIAAEESTASLSLTADEGAGPGAVRISLVAEAETESGSISVPVRGAVVVRSGTPAVTRLTDGITIATTAATEEDDEETPDEEQ